MCVGKEEDCLFDPFLDARIAGNHVGAILEEAGLGMPNRFGNTEQGWDYRT